jgi:hypothetical protein
LSEKSNKQWLIQEMEEKFDEIGLFWRWWTKRYKISIVLFIEKYHSKLLGIFFILFYLIMLTHSAEKQEFFSKMKLIEKIWDKNFGQFQSGRILYQQHLI